MPPLDFLRVLSDDDVKAIHASSLTILEEIGIRVPHQPLLELLRDSGARVDFERQIIKLPAGLVETSVRQLPRMFTWHARNPRYDIVLGDGSVNYIGASTVVTVHDLDGHRRPATLEDARSFSRLKDALPNIQDAYTAVHPVDVPEHACHAHQLYVQFTCSEKPARARMLGAKIARDCIRMARIVAGGADAARARPNLLVVINSVSPLAHAVEQIEALYEFASAGFPMFICPEVQSGGTGPVTLAGLLTMQNAEILGGVCMVQAIAPGLGTGYGTVSNILDMRHGIMPYGTAEGCLINVATAQMARYYGMPSRGTAGFTDSNAVDAQAGLETAMTLLSATLAGIDLMLGAGGLEDALAVSYAKTVLDDELIGYIRRISQSVEVTSETIALDAVRRVGPAGSFLAEPHTLKHFRREHFAPSLSNRAKYDAWAEAGGKVMLDNAREKARNILQEHQPVPLDRGVEQELRSVVREAEVQTL
jgi:trimethylamine--corrinoid protein Co-methyltransferase